MLKLFRRDQSSRKFILPMMNDSTRIELPCFEFWLRVRFTPNPSWIFIWPIVNAVFEAPHIYRSSWCCVLGSPWVPTLLHKMVSTERAISFLIRFIRTAVCILRVSRRNNFARMRVTPRVILSDCQLECGTRFDALEFLPFCTYIQKK